MTRPQIIRADSIDLQDQDNPSAKDHNAKQSQSLGSHQAETLREVAAETAEERRLSWANGDIGDLQQYADELSRVETNGENGDSMQQRDALAIAQNGGGGASDDGDMDTDTDLDDDDMMDKISSSPSIEDEDIDFEFVYALHTFVATVEGQANATKGDTMVLLDDSNSYWWLVRVVKDSSIGYLPAEHIETPTERLARLNKHRNIDLSASMLQDQADKHGGKNPMKSALRRRKKNVTFTAPTYVDYSDFDYSSDEDEAEGDALVAQLAAQQQTNGGVAAADVMEEDESAKVKPLSTRSQKQVKLDVEGEEEDEEDELDADGNPRNSDEIFDGRSGSTRTTKNGTVRNTDSFFKDETVETKKITLTPNLLRDDGESRDSSDSKEVRQRPSFEKELVADKKEDKKKKDKDKKEKDKKPSAFRSLFSRKDKKKSVDDDDESFGKRSMDGKSSMDVESLNSDSASLDIQSPERNVQKSKIQKQQPRAEASLARPGAGSSTMELAQFISSEGKPPNNVANVPPASLRMVDSDHSDSPSPEKAKPSKVSKILHPNEGKPAKVSKAKSRVELDDFDSTDEEEAAPEPSRSTPVQEPSRSTPAQDASRSTPVQDTSRSTPDASRSTPDASRSTPDASRSPPPQATRPVAALAPAFSPEPKRQDSEEKQLRPSLPGAYPDSFLTSASQQTAQAATPSQPRERLSESPVQVSPVNPPTLMGDTSSQEDRSSPISSPSPELVDMDSRGHHNQDSMTSTGTAGTTSTWNDSNLRAFFDSGSDIRDLLVVVYDKTDTTPAGPEHPVAGNLFREQNAKLAEITTQLDNMLGDWLARKQRLRGAV